MSGRRRSRGGSVSLSGGSSSGGPSMLERHSSVDSTSGAGAAMSAAMKQTASSENNNLAQDIVRLLKSKGIQVRSADLESITRLLSERQKETGKLGRELSVVQEKIHDQAQVCAPPTLNVPGHAIAAMRAI